VCNGCCSSSSAVQCSVRNVCTVRNECNACVCDVCDVCNNVMCVQ